MNTIDRNDIAATVSHYLALAELNFDTIIDDNASDEIVDQLKAYADANNITRAGDIPENVMADAIFAHLED